VCPSRQAAAQPRRDDLEALAATALAAQQHPAEETGAEEQVARRLGHGRQKDFAREAGRIGRQHLDIEAEVEGAGEASRDAAEIEDLVVEERVQLRERRHAGRGDAEAADGEVREVGEDGDVHRVVRRERAGVEVDRIVQGDIEMRADGKRLERAVGQLEVDHRVVGLELTRARARHAQRRRAEIMRHAIIRQRRIEKWMRVEHGRLHRIRIRQAGAEGEGLYRAGVEVRRHSRHRAAHRRLRQGERRAADRGGRAAADARHAAARRHAVRLALAAAAVGEGRGRSDAARDRVRCRGRVGDAERAGRRAAAAETGDRRRIGCRIRTGRRAGRRRAGIGVAAIGARRRATAAIAAGGTGIRGDLIAAGQGDGRGRVAGRRAGKPAIRGIAAIAAHRIRRAVQLARMRIGIGERRGRIAAGTRRGIAVAAEAAEGLLREIENAGGEAAHGVVERGACAIAAGRAADARAAIAASLDHADADRAGAKPAGKAVRRRGGAGRGAAIAAAIANARAGAAIAAEPGRGCDDGSVRGRVRRRGARGGGDVAAIAAAARAIGVVAAIAAGGDDLRDADIAGQPDERARVAAIRAFDAIGAVAAQAAAREDETAQIARIAVGEGELRGRNAADTGRAAGTIANAAVAAEGDLAQAQAAGRIAARDIGKGRIAALAAGGTARAGITVATDTAGRTCRHEDVAAAAGAAHEHRRIRIAAGAGGMAGTEGRAAGAAGCVEQQRNSAIAGARRRGGEGRQRVAALAAIGAAIGVVAAGAAGDVGRRGDRRGADRRECDAAIGIAANATRRAAGTVTACAADRGRGAEELARAVGIGEGDVRRAESAVTADRAVVARSACATNRILRQRQDTAGRAAGDEIGQRRRAAIAAGRERGAVAARTAGAGDRDIHIAAGALAVARGREAHRRAIAAGVADAGRVVARTARAGHRDIDEARAGADAVAERVDGPAVAGIAAGAARAAHGDRDIARA